MTALPKNHDTPWKPQQIPQNAYKGTGFSGGSAYHRPEVAHRMAAVIVCWSTVEWYIVEIFSYIINAEGYVAAELMSDVRKFDARLAMFLKHFKRRFGDAPTKEIKRVLNRDTLKALSVERDYLAHGVFRTAQDRKDALIRIDGWGEHERWYQYDIPQLDALFAEIDKVVKFLMHLHMQVIYATPIRYDPGRIVPAGHPQMLAQMREHQSRKKSSEGTQQPSEPPQDQTEPGKPRE